MTTSWCIPLYTFLHAIGICKAQKTLIEAFEPMRTFAKGVIAQAQPNKEGNFIEQHMEEIKGAKPGSRLYTLQWNMGENLKYNQESHAVFLDEGKHKSFFFLVSMDKMDWRI